MRQLAVAVALIATLTVGGVALAATTGDERIYACVNNSDGTMKQVAGPSVSCSKGWHQISWSAENAPAPTPPHIPKTTTYVDFAHIEIDPAVGDANVSCNSGDVATGGGYALGTNNTQTVLANEPLTGSDGITPNSWYVQVTDSAAPGTAEAWVVCQHTE